MIYKIFFWAHYYICLPLAEQGYKGPGKPLIVQASEELGPPPCNIISFSTVSISPFHHSPVQVQHTNYDETHVFKMIFKRRKRSRIFTENDGDIELDWCWKRERHAWCGTNDESAMNRSTLPREVCVPPKGSSLIDHSEVVCVSAACADGTLCYVRWSIGPPCSQLPHPVPVAVIIRPGWISNSCKYQLHDAICQLVRGNCENRIVIQHMLVFGPISV